MIYSDCNILVNTSEAKYDIDKKLLIERYEDLCNTFAPEKVDEKDITGAAETYRVFLDEAYRDINDDVRRATYLVRV